MKNGIWILISSVIGTLLLAIVMAIFGDVNRSVELQENLSTVMEDALQEALHKEGTDKKKEVLGECIEGLALALDSKSDLRLDVYQLDDEKGIIAMRARSSYIHSNGVDGETEWHRIVIHDKEEAETVEYCEVQFYVSKEEMLRERDCYKRISTAKGTCITAPRVPLKEGMQFVEWRDANDYIADFTQGIFENRSYYAVWK